MPLRAIIFLAAVGGASAGGHDREETRRRLQAKVEASRLNQALTQAGEKQFDVPKGIAATKEVMRQQKLKLAMKHQKAATDSIQDSGGVSIFENPNNVHTDGGSSSGASTPPSPPSANLQSDISGEDQTTEAPQVTRTHSSRPAPSRARSFPLKRAPAAPVERVRSFVSLAEAAKRAAAAAEEEQALDQSASRASGMKVDNPSRTIAEAKKLLSTALMSKQDRDAALERGAAARKELTDRLQAVLQEGLPQTNGNDIAIPDEPDQMPFEELQELVDRVETISAILKLDSGRSKLSENTLEGLKIMLAGIRKTLAERNASSEGVLTVDAVEGHGNGLRNSSPSPSVWSVEEDVAYAVSAEKLQEATKCKVGTRVMCIGKPGRIVSIKKGQGGRKIKSDRGLKGSGLYTIVPDNAEESMIQDVHRVLFTPIEEVGTNPQEEGANPGKQFLVYKVTSSDAELNDPVVGEHRFHYWYQAIKQVSQQYASQIKAIPQAAKISKELLNSYLSQACRPKMFGGYGPDSGQCFDYRSTRLRELAGNLDTFLMTQLQGQMAHFQNTIPLVYNTSVPARAFGATTA